MATVGYTVTNFDETPHAKLVTWTLGDADVGAPIGDAFLDFTDRSVHFVGTWDTAAVVWQGCNDDSNYQTLYDADGDAITETQTIKPNLVREMTRYQRPSSSGGGGSTAVTVTVLMIRKRP